MFQIASYQTTTLLPNPAFSDSESLTDSVSAEHAIDGTLYTYVKTKAGRRKLQWTFNVSRNKGLELRAFLTAYFASPIDIIDHNGRKWSGYFTNNPFEFRSEKKAGPAIQNWPRGEGHSITLEFEGIENA